MQLSFIEINVTFTADRVNFNLGLIRVFEQLSTQNASEMTYIVSGGALNPTHSLYPESC